MTSRYFDASSSVDAQDAHVSLSRTEKLDKTRCSEDFEKILLDTSYVKRVGQGFQSNVAGPVGTGGPIRKRKSATNFFTTLRRPKPELHQDSVEFDRELGVLGGEPNSTPAPQQDAPSSLSIVRRAVRVVLGDRSLSTKKSRTF